MEAIARQPEASGDIRMNMIIAAALIEGVALLAVVVCLLVSMQANRPVGKLHPLAAKRVCAAAQARAAQVIASVLTEHESDIYLTISRISGISSVRRI